MKRPLDYPQEEEEGLDGTEGGGMVRFRAPGAKAPWCLSEGTHVSICTPLA
jgi:hypothetical protein